MKCGFAKQDITPAPGRHMEGHPRARVAQKANDPLYVRCVALENEGLAILLCYDLVGIKKPISEGIRAHVAQVVGCEKRDVFITSTHTHSGPNIGDEMWPIDQGFVSDLKDYAARAALDAVADLRPGRMYSACGQARDISFVRRFRMKDGSCRTNPGYCNPDIVGPMNEGDDSLRLVKIEREGAGDVILVNFQVHPDVVKNGMPEEAYSADYCGMVCKTLEQAIPGSDCIYLNGTAGDLNHVDVRTKPDTEGAFGLRLALHMARTIAAEVLRLYTKAQPLADGPVRTVERLCDLPLRKPDPKVLEHAEDYLRWHNAGQSEKIPYEGMEYITAIYEAVNQLELVRLNGELKVWVNGLSVGDLAIVGIPGEPFCEVGKQVRAQSPFPVQFVLGLSNGCEGYYPTRDAYEVNGYEARTSFFHPGVAEGFVQVAGEVLQELKG